MKPLTRLLAGALLALGCAGAAFAQQGKPVVIHPSIPPVTSAKDAPFPGWYELEASGKTFYLSADGRFMMLGKVVDLGGQTAGFQQPQQAAASLKIDAGALPLQNAMRIVNGTGKRKVYIFSDPDCPFCKQLETELPKIADATIYLFPYPLVTLHPQARDRAIGAWCQSDRVHAWRDTILLGKSYTGTCVNPVDANVELGMKKLRVFSTPTIFNSDGNRIEGFVPAAQINAFIK